jgi:hypothetical protein
MTTAPALRLTATYDDAGNAHSYGFSLRTATVEDAKAFVARFPKSARFRASNLSGDPEHKGFVGLSGSLHANGVRGEKNETAIKRYHAVIRHCEKLGIEIDYRTPYVSSFETRKAFEAAL